MLHNDQDKTQADLTDSNAQDAETKAPAGLDGNCLLYTSDAADE